MYFLLKYIHPFYEFTLSGGILSPTSDSSYYDQYYSTHPTWFIQVSGSYLYWINNFGFSLGATGRYLTNSSSGSTTILGNVPVNYVMTLTSLTAELMGGIRYRNPQWLYIQPGIYVGAGVTRLREEDAAPSLTSSSPTTSTLGVTQYSPVLEVGTNIDFSLYSLQSKFYSAPATDFWLKDVLLRLSGSYNYNPTPALSSTGFLVQTGFVFLL